MKATATRKLAWPLSRRQGHNALLFTGAGRPDSRSSNASIYSISPSPAYFMRPREKDDERAAAVILQLCLVKLTDQDPKEAIALHDAA